MRCARTPSQLQAFAAQVEQPIVVRSEDPECHNDHEGLDAGAQHHRRVWCYGVSLRLCSASRPASGLHMFHICTVCSEPATTRLARPGLCQNE
jgi:hypothetical protein